MILFKYATLTAIALIAIYGWTGSTLMRGVRQAVFRGALRRPWVRDSFALDTVLALLYCPACFGVYCLAALTLVFNASGALEDTDTIAWFAQTLVTVILLRSRLGLTESELANEVQPVLDRSKEIAP